MQPASKKGSKNTDVPAPAAGILAGLTRISHPIFARSGVLRVDLLNFRRARGPVASKTREELELCRDEFGGPGDDAASVTRCGGACQAGGARAFAGAARRVAASPQAWAAGQPDAIATLIRRTLTRTRAPILSSLRRMVPQVALANCV